MYRIRNIRLKPWQDIEMIPDLVRKKIGARGLVLKNISVARESIDARDKSDIRKVYAIDFDADVSMEKAARYGLEIAPDMSYEYVNGGMPKKRPVIVGFGPCGMFAGLAMAKMGLAPIIVERGQPVSQRVSDVSVFWQNGKLDPESNVQFGEGGAGAFSDGKLTTGTNDVRVRKVLVELVAAGADKDILYKQRPHIGTDKLRDVVTNIRHEIEQSGGEVMFGARVDAIETEGRGESRNISGVVLSDGRRIKTDDLVLAIGHSARDTFSYLAEMGISMTQKAFSIGVRVEHPQELINAAQYGDAMLAKFLGPAEYKLSCHTDEDRGVYTFCMCPGGEVIAATSQAGMLVTNGMSYHARNGKYANSGLLVDVRTSDFGCGDVLAGVRFQEKHEKMAYEIARAYKPLKTSWQTFEGSDVAACLPDFAVCAIKQAMPVLGRKVKGFDGDAAMMYGVETRSSSPVRIIRNERMMSSIEGIYPAGEGAGYAGGIVSAAVDGIKVAEAVSARYKDH